MKHFLKILVLALFTVVPAGYAMQQQPRTPEISPFLQDAIDKVKRLIEKRFDRDEDRKFYYESLAKIVHASGNDTFVLGNALGRFTFRIRQMRQREESPDVGDVIAIAKRMIVTMIPEQERKQYYERLEEIVRENGNSRIVLTNAILEFIETLG